MCSVSSGAAATLKFGGGGQLDEPRVFGTCTEFNCSIGARGNSGEGKEDVSLSSITVPKMNPCLFPLQISLVPDQQESE